MGIDVYLRWRYQTPEDRAAQDDAHFSVDGGHVGYLRESYMGLTGLVFSVPAVGLTIVCS
jgi:hypothetical protein